MEIPALRQLAILVVLAGSVLVAVGCGGTRDFRRHGKVWRVTDDAEATYRQAVLDLATVQHRFGGDAGEACKRAKELGHQYKDWDDDGVSPATLLEVDRQNLCGLAAVQDRKRKQVAIEARKQSRETRQSTDAEQQSTAATSTAGTLPPSAHVVVSPEDAPLPCSVSSDCLERGLCDYSSTVRRCVVSVEGCQRSLKCRQDGQCTPAAGGYSCAKDGASGSGVDSQLAHTEVEGHLIKGPCALGLSRLDYGPGIVAQLTFIANGGGPTHAQYVALRAVGLGSEEVGIFEARRRLMDPERAPETFARIVDKVRCMEGTTLSRAFLLETGFNVRTEAAIELIELTPFTSEEAALVEAEIARAKARGERQPAKGRVKHRAPKPGRRPK